MTDLEMTRLCAEAMGYVCSDRQSGIHGLWINWNTTAQVYDPLCNDAQAMALVKHFCLDIGFGNPQWTVMTDSRNVVKSDDLNRAIVECVAKMQVNAATKE